MLQRNVAARCCYRTTRKASRTAEDLETNVRVVTYLRALGDVSAHKCRNALLSRTPPLNVSEGVLKQWISKYRRPAAAVVLSCAEDLETKYGATIRHLAAENRTGYKLMVALKTLKPPLYASKRTSETWLRKYGLRTESSPAGALMDAVSVEEALGERLRRDENKQSVADYAAAQSMSEDFAQEQPPVSVTALTLRQWYIKYHPDSGPLKYQSAKEMEDDMGDEIRSELALWVRKAVSQRHKAVLVSERSCKTWLAQYGIKAPAASGVVSPTIHKRPATHRITHRVLKRPSGVR